MGTTTKPEHRPVPNAWLHERSQHRFLECLLVAGAAHLFVPMSCAHVRLAWGVRAASLCSMAPTRHFTLCCVILHCLYRLSTHLRPRPRQDQQCLRCLHAPLLCSTTSTGGPCAIHDAHCPAGTQSPPGLVSIIPSMPFCRKASSLAWHATTAHALMPWPLHYLHEVHWRFVHLSLV